nr:RNA-directed DNA polymerase [Thermosipho japonicus]
MEENLDGEAIWVHKKIKNKEKDFDVWKSKFPLFCYKNIDNCTSKIDKLFYMKIDIKRFFPSINIKNLLNNVKKILEFTSLSEDKNKIKNYLEKLLNFQIKGAFGNHDSPTNVGLPVGLLASGFMSNIYLFNLDVKMDELINEKFDNREIFGYFRYVDDIVLISSNFQTLINTAKDIEKDLKELGLSINLDKLKPSILNDYYKYCKAFLDKNTNDNNSFFNRVLNLLKLNDSNKINDDEEKFNENFLRIIFNEDDLVEIDSLRKMFLENFTLTRENYQDFQTTVFNEMSILSEKIFGLSTMKELLESFDRTRNLIRSYFDEDKIAPQTRRSFSAHLITKIVENALKHPLIFKSEQWCNLEKELKLEGFSNVIKLNEERENKVKIRTLIENALLDLEYAIINTPSKTKLYKRYIELIFLIYSNGDKFSDPCKNKIKKNYLVKILDFIEEKVMIENDGKAYLYLEFLKYINQVLRKNLYENVYIPEEFIRDINNVIKKILDGKKMSLFENNPMLVSELLDLITLLDFKNKKFKEKILKGAERISNENEYKKIINSKVSVYNLSTETKDDESLCYKLLINMFRAKRDDLESSKLILESVENNKNISEKLKAYMFFRMYSSLENKKLKEEILIKSLKVLEEIKDNDGINKLVQLLVKGTYDNILPDTASVKKTLKDLIDKTKEEPNRELILNNINEYLQVKCQRDKSDMGEISLTNFVKIAKLSYFQKLLLIYLLFEIQDFLEDDLDGIFKIKIDTKSFNKLSQEILGGKKELDKLDKKEEEKEKDEKEREEDIKKVIKVTSHEDSLTKKDKKRGLYWIIIQILKQEFLLESFSSQIELEKRNLFRDVWKELTENLIASSSIINKLSDAIGKYSYVDLKPYESSKKELKEIIRLELENIISQKQYTMNIRLPLIIYGKASLKPFLRIGIFQPTINYFAGNYKYINNDMSYKEPIVSMLRKEIIVALKVFQEKDIDLLIAPELSIPKDIEKDIIEWSKKTGKIAIYGTEYYLNNDEVSNRYVLLWPYNDIYLLKVHGLKKYFNNVERKYFKERNITIVEDDKIVIYSSENIGVFSILICYDALSLETLSFLKGYVDTIFVPAYNKDVNTYIGLADAMSKLVFCNFVIANTGVYGGSVVRIPYYDIHKREALTLEGNRIFGAQVVDIPIKHLQNYRKEISKMGEEPNDRKFKAFPPGYEYREI